ncbi:substrate-binding periplasmic protein [Dongshaea marina]|uniref:substrate-binding periplasmic protein n=1 Tax=Dongshaea marina TaxID=2047966 RepID=UPI00131EEEDD|nr:transporter substrate-binding domain-containing protein [Dongshaea marina]
MAVAKSVFAKAGYELVVEFYPWNRAVNLAKTNKKYAGYFPEYYAKDLEKDFIFSKPFGKGPLGFAELKSKPVPWSSLDDLKGMKLGTVAGYVNTQAFDDMVASGGLKADAARSDMANLQKVGAGRIQLAVIDENVMHYLLKTEPALKRYADKIGFNAKVLEDKKLYVCFRRDGADMQMIDAFNKAVDAVNAAAMLDKKLK